METSVYGSESSITPFVKRTYEIDFIREVDPILPNGSLFQGIVMDSCHQKSRFRCFKKKRSE